MTSPNSRIIAIVNGKGGVGKTTTTTHLGGLAAAAGFKTLIVDLDPQGNCGEDLGYSGASLSDEGKGLVAAAMSGGTTSPTVLRDVRPGLDVIPGGTELDSLADVLDGKRKREGQESALVLARALAPVVSDYDLVLLDCPPRHEVLQGAALVAARWVIFPTKSDASSRKGFREMARRFAIARAVNPDLELLGVVLYGVNHAATRIKQEVRELIEEELQGAAPVFEATIRHVEAAAYDIRQRGQLAHELEHVVLSGPKWYEQLRSGKPAHRLAASSASLAGDFAALTEEILTSLVNRETLVAEALA